MLWSMIRGKRESELIPAPACAALPESSDPEESVKNNQSTNINHTDETEEISSLISEREEASSK